MNKKKSILLLSVATSAVAATCLCAVNFANEQFALTANSANKNFTYNAGVGSQFSGSSSIEKVSVETGMSDPIETQISFNTADCSLTYGENSRFLEATPVSNFTTFSFKAGINNLLSFKMRFGVVNPSDFIAGGYSINFTDENNDYVGGLSGAYESSGEVLAEWTNETDKTVKVFDFTIMSVGSNSIYVSSIYIEWGC